MARKRALKKGIRAPKVDKENQKPRRVRCPICKRYLFPSEDHIPPASCGNSEPVIEQGLISPKNGRKALIKQRGLTSKFICEECNNQLGLKADKALSSLWRTVEDSKNQKAIEWTGDIQEVVKSAFGHLLASGRFSSCIIDKGMRDFIGKGVIPEGLYLYLFRYPYDEIFTIRDTAVILHFPRPSFSLAVRGGSCLYFPHLGFLITTRMVACLGVDLLEAIRKDSTSITIPFNGFINPVSGSPLPPKWPFQISNEPLPDTIDGFAVGLEGLGAKMAKKYKKDKNGH